MTCSMNSGLPWGGLQDAARHVWIEVAPRHQLLGKGLGIPFAQGFEHDG